MHFSFERYYSFCSTPYIVALTLIYDILACMHFLSEITWLLFSALHTLINKYISLVYRYFFLSRANMVFVILPTYDFDSNLWHIGLAWPVCIWYFLAITSLCSTPYVVVMILVYDIFVCMHFSCEIYNYFCSTTYVVALNMIYDILVWPVCIYLWSTLTITSPNKEPLLDTMWCKLWQC